RCVAPGIGESSLGLAGLLGLLWVLRERETNLPGDLWLVANVGEEGLGDLCGMRAVVDRFGDNPLAYIVLEGMALGQIYHRGLGVQRYRITAQTQGGHSWADYGVPSAIHELAALVTNLNEIPLPKDPRTTLNVGMISGGTSINTIAPQASLELDLRSEDPEALQTLVQSVEALVEEADGAEVQMQAEVIGQRPAGEIPGDHPLVKLAESALIEQGIQPHLSIGSTDANIPLSRGLPAVTVGLTTGKGAHTIQEYIETGPLAQGLEQLLMLVEKFYL
ncbi:MAG: M20/M25/M40 family metallo-hydrolase, partial [Chloroflexi bacterium]|nr:M20/M25/M40 family metallo-hydrolase [Chloroflexota bacterium]